MSDQTTTYNITHFPQLTNSHKKTDYCFTWPELAKLLTHPRPEVPKKRQSLWSPAVFDGPRKLVHVKAVSCLVFDIDDGIKYEQVKNTMEQHNAAYIMHSTINHTEEKHRFRVIMPLKTPIERDLWSYVYEYAMEWFESKFKHAADPACRDASRAFFLSYKTSTYRSDYSLDGKIYNWKPGGIKKQEAAKKEHEKRLKKNAERAKRAAAANREQRHNKKWCFVDWKHELKIQLKTSPAARRALAEKLGCTIKNVHGLHGPGLMATGFNCPYCGRSDTTYFMLDPNIAGVTSGFCNHRKSCGDGANPNSFSLFYLASKNNLV